MSKEDNIFHFSTEETTPRSVLADALNKADTYKTVVVLAIGNNEDEDILIGHSTASVSEKIGLCAFAEHRFSDELLNG